MPPLAYACSMRMVFCLLSLSAAFAQVNLTVSTRGDEIMITCQPSEKGHMKYVIGSPYSADFTSQHTQTLGDGTTITDPPGSQHQARDGQGRLRIDVPLVISKEDSKGWAPHMIQVSDPVSGYLYVYDDQNQVVHRLKLNELPKREGRRSFVIAENQVAVSDKDHHETKTENLGEKTIEGVMVKGVRYTTTWPAGTRNNNRPMVTSQETWFSDDLQEVIYQVLANPQNGEIIHRFEKIDRTEPDPTLFQPPVEYKVVDEDGLFTLTLRHP